MSELHIGERIQKSLEGHGFKFSGADMAWCAMRNFPELAGQLSNGNRMVRIRISENCQWVEKIDGWGNIDRRCACKFIGEQARPPVSPALYMQRLDTPKPRYWKNPRPTGNRTGKPRNIYLDDATFEAAKLLGDGSASLGIKRAFTAKSS